MSVRKYARQSEGHYEKICLLSESEKYPSKSHQSAVHNDLLSSKERISPHGGSNSSSSRRSEYMSSQNKNNIKSTYSNTIQRQKDTGSPSTERHNSSSHSSRHSKIHDNNDDDNFEWTTHVSSSGKTYYYNKRSEKSQWEKPKEWIERENRIRNREREKRNRESSNRDSKESSKYPKMSPFKKEYISSRNSPYAKRNHENPEAERPKAIQTQGCSTSAVSTASSRYPIKPVFPQNSLSCHYQGSSGCPTPETIGSPIGSVQDISPPSTPSNSTSMSPFINSSSTVNHVTSPHVFTNSSAHSPYQSSALTPNQLYQNKYAQNDRKLNAAAFNLQGSPRSAHPTSHSNSESATASTPALHPLQQAMLLRQQQQQQQMVAQQSLYGNSSVAQLAHSPYGQLSNVVDQKRRSDAGPPPPPPHSLEKTATPPPPPPPAHLEGNHMTPSGYSVGRYRDPRTANMKTTYMQSYEPAYSTINVDNGGWDNSNQKPTVMETPVPELPDITQFSQFCCKKAFEDIAGWMGCILERQAALVCNEVDSCLGITSERSKANLTAAGLASCVTDARQLVVSSRKSCILECLERVEGLQDSRIERQDSKSKHHGSSFGRGDSRTTHTDLRTERRDSKS